jgi:hypothetical protein
MSINTQASVLAKRRAGSWIAGFGKAFAKLILDRWWSYQSQFFGNIDLQVVEFAALSSTDVVLAGFAQTLYAIVLTKATATAAFFKATNNATTCTTNGGQDISIRLNKAAECLVLFGAGLTLSTGLTVQGNTTATGATGSAADGPSGFVIFGA